MFSLAGGKRYPIQPNRRELEDVGRRRPETYISHQLNALGNKGRQDDGTQPALDDPGPGRARQRDKTAGNLPETHRLDERFVKLPYHLGTSYYLCCLC